MAVLAGASLALSATVSAQTAADKPVASKTGSGAPPTGKATAASAATRAAKPADKRDKADAKPSTKPAATAAKAASPTPEPAAARMADVDTTGMTRLQVCQMEIQGAKGNRSGLLRACLNRRLKGENLAGRDCRRQAALGAKSQSARSQAMARCGGVPQKMKDGKPVGSGSKPKAPAAAPAPNPAAGEKA